MSENDKNLPTGLGDDTTLLPVPTNVEYLDARDDEAFGAGDTFIFPQFLSEPEADAALKKLATEIPFQQWYHMPSKKSVALRPLSRVKCALALQREDGAIPHYRFPVNDQQRYPVVTIDDENTPTLLAILQKVREKTQVPYNHVVVLYYKDGTDAIGFHKDKTLDLCENSPIISISLGAERPYVLKKDNIFNPTATQQVTLPHGSLLALGPKTNADWYHSVIMLKDDKTVQPRISITFRNVETYKTVETGELTGKGDQFQELNWPQQLRGDHRTDNYLDVPDDCSRLLQFWFGQGDEMEYRGALWWRGLMADAKGTTVPERREFTDKYVCEQWGDKLLQKAKKFDRDWLGVWTKTPLGSVAAIILYDQLPRHAFRGTERAFQFDSIACSIATNLLDEHPSLFTSASVSRDDKNDARFPWTYQIFVYMALIHSEEIDMCERGACGLANLYEILKNDTQGTLLCSRLLPLMRSAKQHLVALSDFGRYPHRNAALMRKSTPEEVEFLTKIPRNSWMKSQMTVVDSTTSSNTKEGNDGDNSAQQQREKKHCRDGFRVLVLHSNRQTPSVFQRKTRDAFSRAVGPGSTLVYAAAPHKYVARGEALDNTKHLLASQSPTTRCWWNATDDAATMVYVGIEESIEYIDDVFQKEGPFDGIIGFSQGATLAGLIASLVSNQSPRVTNVAKSLRFCVMISGFCVRDTRSEYRDLTTKPIEIPSFHVWGVNDVLVLPERSKALQDSFASSANNIQRVTSTHHLDHFAKAIAVWPVDQICDWIRTNFNPHISSEATCTSSLRTQLIALREQRIFSKTEPKTVDERLLSIFERLVPNVAARGCTVVLNQVDIVLLGARREMASAKQRELTLVAEDLISLGKQFPSLDNWTEKVETVLDVFPNAVRAFYIADKRVDVFRNGLINAVAHSIDVSLKHKECDFIAQQLPGASNHNYAKNGLVAAIVARFPQFRVLKRNVAHGVDVAESYRLLIDALKLYVAVSASDKKAAQRQSSVQRVPKNAEQWKKMFSRPLSDFIVNPRAEPVDVATAEEMQHLHKYLRSCSWPNAEKVGDNSNGDDDYSDAVFPRGTLTSDGRLDLCKQVIGRTGVSDLELSLKIDGESPLPRVKHLLLGNNIAGLPLAQSVAQMIKDKSTSITTWYIAGNELDADSIGLVADALSTDDRVVQLWLKRNPLKPKGALALCSMLRVNTFLKVLDLTNTGLLDKGVTTLCTAIVDNPNCALTVLYLDSNGLTPKSIPDVCNVLKQSQITDICLGCNRLGDTGAAMIAEVLDCIEFLEMASCGIGPQGAEALAKSLSANKTLRKLDLGHLRSTNALGEIANAIQNDGATSFASALSTNSTLLSLNLLHNGIYQQGVSNLAKALVKNRTLLYLNIEQLGIPHNELTREAIRVSLKRNMDALTDAERLHANSLMNREHLSQIKSVYRTEQ